MVIEYKDKPVDHIVKIKNLKPGTYLATMLGTGNEVLIIVACNSYNENTAMYCYVDNSSGAWVHANGVNNYEVKNPQPVHIDKIDISKTK